MKNILIGILAIISLFLATVSCQLRHDMKKAMTSEYNRGYRYGRHSGFAEAYNCHYNNRPELEKAFVSMSKNIAEMGEISLEDALNYPCEE